MFTCIINFYYFTFYIFFIGFTRIHRYAHFSVFSVQDRLETFQVGDDKVFGLAVNGYFVSKDIELTFTCTLCHKKTESMLCVINPDSFPIPYHVCDCPIDRSILNDFLFGNTVIHLYGCNIIMKSRILKRSPVCVYCKMVPENGHILSCIFYNHSALKKSLSTCVVCLEPATILFPCRHVACCPSCTLNVEKCPICRAHVDYFKILNFR